MGSGVLASQTADSKLLFRKGCPRGSSIFHNSTTKFTFPVKVCCLRAYSSPLCWLHLVARYHRALHVPTWMQAIVFFFPFLSHPKLGVNLARSSQIMFCTPWLSKCKIHVYIFSWSSFPYSWDNSNHFLFDSAFSFHTLILHITGSNVVVKSLWLACTSFHSCGREINAEM